MVRTLPDELHKQAAIIAEFARREELDFYPTIFEMLSADQVSQVAAYGGFPQRYPHWRFGMEYERLRKQHTYGLGRIYEMVINNDPCYAYLLEDNTPVDQKTVMAHVYGHCDFFKNNYWFSRTNRRMMDEMANHATRVRRYIKRHGLDRVEKFIDTCLSLEDLIDPHSVFMQRDARRAPRKRGAEAERKKRERRHPLPRQVVHGPLHQPAGRSMDERAASGWRKTKQQRGRVPARPQRDRAACSCWNTRRWKTGKPTCWLDHPGRVLLLCAAGSDQDHERRAGPATGTRRS
jgi:stage V sporulation protein R